MGNFLLGIYIGLGIVCLAAIVFALIVLVYFLAKNNLFCTFVEEGTAKAILKYGKFHKIIMSYEGYNLNDNWEVIAKPGKETQLGGLKWVGIPFIHSVYRYTFKWVSFEQKEEEGKLVQKAISHEEEIDYIIVQDDIYYTFVREAEARGMVPLNIDALLTIRILNPYKALFRVQDWLEATQNQFKPVLVGYTGQKSFEELIEAQKQVGDTVHELLRTSKIDEDIEEDYGVHIKKIGIVNIDPASERGEKYVEAASKQWEAEKEAKRLKSVYEQIQELGDDGLLLRAIEGIEEASKGQGNLVIFPFGSVQSMFEGWLGKEKKQEKGGI